MTVGQLMEKTQEFSSVPDRLDQVPILGTNASNKKKGAMTEVALTRREKRRQTAQAAKEDDKQPEAWDSHATIAPDVQCPPKKRGRKPKDRKDEEKQDKPARAKVPQSPRLRARGLPQRRKARQQHARKGRKQARMTMQVQSHLVGQPQTVRRQNRKRHIPESQQLTTGRSRRHRRMAWWWMSARLLPRRFFSLI